MTRSRSSYALVSASARRPILNRVIPSLERLEDRTLLDGANGSTVDSLFAREAYHVLLNREPNASEVAAWANAIDQGMARTAAVQDFVHSSEYAARITEETYRQLLGRDPEPSALGSWVEFIQHRGTYQGLVERVLSSPEYFNRHGGDIYQWTTALYADVLGRQPEWAGLYGWILAANAGMSRDDIANGFLRSEESRDNAVRDAYETLLGRAPDAAAFSIFVSALNQGMRQEDLIAAVAGSDEFAQLVGAGQPPSSLAESGLTNSSAHSLIRPFATFASANVAVPQTPESGDARFTAPSVAPLVKGSLEPGGGVVPLMGDCGCGTGSSDGENISVPPGGTGGNPMSYSYSANPVRYFDGIVRLIVPLLSSAGYGEAWGYTLTWTNNNTASGSTAGSGMVPSQLPHIVHNFDGEVDHYYVITSGINSRVFDDIGTGPVERYFLADKLVINSVTHEYVFTDSAGVRPT